MLNARLARRQAATPSQRAKLLAALLDGNLQAFDQVQRERGLIPLENWSWPAPLLHAAALGGA
jgi:hypothetical protein